MKESSRSSAAGERSAVTGFLRQYEFAACKLLRSLQAGALTEVRILDEDAGVFDDVVFIEGGDLHAYQIKTTEKATAYRLPSALRPAIAKLLASWRKLRTAYPDKRIVCSYVFAGYPDASTQARAPGSTLDFVSFFNSKNALKDPSSRATWLPWLEQLIAWSEASEPEFWEFAESLQLFSKDELDRNRIEALGLRDRQTAKAIEQLIPQLIANRSKKVVWTEDELLHELGIKRALSGRFLHSFPTHSDDQENLATKADLWRTIDGHESGYICLLGPPGTGKSTLLARELRPQSQLRVVRYLAFTPDERHGIGRAEAISFLNDVVNQLSRQALRGPEFALEDRSMLQNAFSNQLSEAGADYKATGRKTIVIVDGLDHKRGRCPQIVVAGRG